MHINSNQYIQFSITRQRFQKLEAKFMNIDTNLEDFIREIKVGIFQRHQFRTPEGLPLAKVGGRARW